MAAGDTALWLHNKLGSTDDLWSGKSICSQITHAKLLNIQECFHALQSHVKVKLLLSFLHIPRRNVEQWQTDLDEIIMLGINDPDPWVAAIGEIMRDFPSTGSLLMVEQDNRTDSVMLVCLDEMKYLAENSNVNMIPLECQYLNKASFAAAAGPLPEPAKHFTVKRKPKSAALRAEIVQKSSETLLNKRNHPSSSLPIKSRSFAKKMDMTPLKMPPSRSLSNSDFRSPNSSDFRSPNSSLRIGSPLSRSPITPMQIPSRHSSAKKDSKIKLLEIEDMPVGAKEAKRRKKVAELAQETQRKEREAAAAAAAATTTGTNNVTSTTATTAAPASYTPDYAAGLLPPAAAKMPMTVLNVSTSALTQPTPAYLPSQARPNSSSMALGGVGAISVSTQPTTSSKQLPQNLSQQLKQQLLKTSSSLTVSPASTIITTNSTLVLSATPSQQQKSPLSVGDKSPGFVSSPTNVLAGVSSPVATTLPLTKVRGKTPQQQTVFVPAQGPTTLVRPQQLVTLRPAIQPVQGQIQATSATPLAGLGTGLRLATPIGQATAIAPAAVAAPAKKGLSLTKEQMHEAQEMFKVSNKVSRPEKALILGFMAGSRENPCPKQGDVLNIKLSESEEVVQLPDGTKKKKIEDTYFQMNYATGEWKRFHKVRDAVIS
ncbi:negative elongation factor A [Elysia marginata]|uniref:Negative elongation factor A n=1 Tax=Elysia marginata TaxID=1093978 RepID=A0AAV4HV70_9GAST|nr:negative elongation factor A [Elysia marginata]